MIRFLTTAAILLSVPAVALAEQSFVERYKAECEKMGEVKYCDCVLEKLDEEVYLESYDGWTEEELSEDEDMQKASEACFHLLAIDG